VTEITVAVVSYNTRALLERCLASLAPTGADVWVVDNGSTDGSRDIVAPERLIVPERNLGYGAAVNLVAARAYSPWLVASNADVVVEPGALDALAAAAGPRTGAVAPRLVLPDGSTQHSVLPFPTVGFTAAFAAGLTSAVPRLGDRWCVPGRWDASRAREVPWAVGAFLLLRRSAFEEVGGFDERQWLFAEDLDLGWRLARAGWTTRYEPSAVVHHHESAATGVAFGDARTERTQAATYAWLRRRRGRAVAATVAALNVAGAAARRDRRWAGIHARTGLGLGAKSSEVIPRGSPSRE
jgi:N-acetylglucosaminyl-diphospho-decaprenol L-rhamnosyltransferase